MESRLNLRRRIVTSIVCRRFSSVNGGEEIAGKMTNCCSTGFMAELTAHVKRGTILVVRTTGNSWGGPADKNFRSLSLAEVRWSKPKTIEGDISYATGLKYLMAD